jgi:hypothetical protein
MIVNERFAGGPTSWRPLAPGTQSVTIAPEPLKACDHSRMITGQSTSVPREEPITSRTAVGMKAPVPGRIDSGNTSLVANWIIDGEEESPIVEFVFCDRTEVLASLDERSRGSGGVRLPCGAERLGRERGCRDIRREHVGNGPRELRRRGRVPPSAARRVAGGPPQFHAGAQALNETRPHPGTPAIAGAGHRLRRVARREEGIAQFHPRFFALALRIGESLQPAQSGLENRLRAGPALHRPKDHWRQRITIAEGGIPIRAPCPISRLPAGEKLHRRSPRRGVPGRHGLGRPREQKSTEARGTPQEFTSGLRHGTGAIGPRPTAPAQAGCCLCAYRPRCAPRAARARPSPCRTYGP